MKKITDWFLDIYQNRDLVVQRKSLYTFYFTLLGLLFTITGFIIELMAGMNTVISSTIGILLFITALFFIKRGYFYLVNVAIIISGTLFAIDLLRAEGDSTIFFLHCLLGLFMISILHVRKFDYYFGVSIVTTVVGIKVVKLQLQAKTPEEMVPNFYLLMIFSLFFILSLLITKIINEEIKRSQDLSKSNFELEKSNKAKIDFISNVSHELRTPLNGIIGTTELISFNKEAKVFQNDLDTILNSARHLLILINQILNISKINHEEFKLNKDYYSLHEIIEELEEMFYGISNKKGINFYAFISNKISDKHYLDKFKLKQVIINLLSNAFKFTNEGFVLLTVEKIDSTFNKEKIKISVKDSGIGIKIKDQKKIFEEFKQGEIDFAKQFEGTGLGLSIAGKIIENMNSKITLESKQNKGSTFSFELSCDIKTLNNSICVSEKNILLICNDEIVTDFFIKNFNDFGVIHYIADDLEEAEEYLHEIENISYIFSVGRPLNTEVKKLGIFKKFEVFYFESTLKHNSSDKNLVINQKNIQNILLDKNKKIQPVNFNEDKKNKYIGITTLIVEDNPINSNILRRYLKLANINAKVAADANECYEIIKNNNYDLIFLDIQLPKIDGFQVLKKIKETLVNKPIVIAFSASISSEFKNMCLEKGFDDFIAKPFTCSDIDTLLYKYFQFNLDQSKENSNDEIIDLLKTDCLEKIERIEFYIEKENFNKISELAHYMKSGAGTAKQIKLYNAISTLAFFANKKDKANILITILEIKTELDNIGEN